MKTFNLKFSFFLLFFMFFSPLSSYAVATYSCNGETVTDIHAGSNDAITSYSENTIGANTARYFMFTPAVGGEITVSYGQNNALSEEKQTLEIGTTCGGVEVYKNVSGQTSDSYKFYTSAGTTYYVRISEKNGANALRFTATFDFKALKVGFEVDTYNISEDITIADNATTLLPIKLTLTHAVSFDFSVIYNTVDGTATDVLDYNAIVGGIVTFTAGETEKIVYVAIKHDVPVELQESFFVSISSVTAANPSYNNVISIGDYSPTEIIILEQTIAQVCFEDNFNSTLDADWRTLFSSGGFTPQIVNNRLRMTTASGNLATAVTKDYEFAAKSNLLVIEFDHFAYSGSGADGFSVVLYDSSIGASPVPGAFGGSLGYANRTGVNGFEGGWLGLGLDEYGNYANPTEGRNGGIGFETNAVSIRGKGTAETGYDYLAGTNTLSPVLWSTTNNYSGGRFKMTVDSRDTAHLYITLERDSNRDGGYESTIINRFDAIGTQGASPEYVRLAITASTGSSDAIHEIDDLIVSGVCRPYAINPPVGVVSQADIVNNFVDSATYNGGTKYITTKVSAKTEEITGVYLNDAGNSESYSATDVNLKFRIIPYLSDSTCTDREVIRDVNGDPAVITISDGQAANSIDVVMPSGASKDSRFVITALDFNEVYMDSGQACIINAVTTGNLQGISQCANSEGQYELAFGSTALQRCAVNNGAPCQSNNHGVSCGHEQLGGLTEAEKVACGYNPLYDDAYGCLMCTLDAETTCSSDNFAIRPDTLAVTSGESHYPDLMRAGQDYNVTVYGYDYGVSSGTATTPNYTFVNADENLTITQDRLLQDNTIDNTLHGTFSFSGDFDMLNGKSTNGISEEVVSIYYTDVGKVTMKIQDQSWAAVDTSDVNNVNDATTHDCAGAYACGNVNTTFIPHHFSFVDLNLTNNNGKPGIYTYISNLNPADTSTFGMAARIDTRIEARNKGNAITENFKTGSNYYENPIAIDISYNDGLHGDANTTDIPESLLGFGLDNGDVNGTRTFLWNDDTNLSKVLRLNFQRNVNQTINPFDLNGSDLNVTIISNYSGTAPEGTASITDDGSAIGTATGTPTMVYGRTHASRQIYDVPTGTANIYFEVFCSNSIGTTCNKTLLPNGVDSNRTDDTRWFINKFHSVPNDGNPGTVIEKDSLVNVTAGVVNTAPNPNTVDLTYNGSSYPYKTTMQNDASPWLIYNKDDPTATRNQFSVEFVQSGDWSGEHETNTTTKDVGSAKTNRRSMW